VEAIAQPFTYVGQYGVMTEADNLYYMRARYYDAQVGRFIKEDPIGMAGGLNLYAYVGGNPVTGVDPEGTWVVNAVGGIIGGIAGGIGACLDGCDLTDVLIGAGTGAIAGVVSPLTAARTAAGTIVRGAGLGAATNATAQSINIALDESKTFNNLNYGEIAGSAFGGGSACVSPVAYRVLCVPKALRGAGSTLRSSSFVHVCRSRNR